MIAIAKPPYCPAVGPRTAKIVFVGEAPGANEERAKVPFVGFSGQLFRETLAKVGINERDVFITNVCHYRPPNNEISKWIPKKKKVFQPNELVLEGIRELYKDLAEIKPNIIVPLGNWAMWALTGLQTISRRRGSIYPVQPNVGLFQQLLTSGTDEFLTHFAEIQGRKVIPTLHPAAVGREWNLKPIFDFDMKRIAGDSLFPELRLPERKIILDPWEPMANSLLPQILNAKLLACDIEVVSNRMYCIAFAWERDKCLVLKADKPWKQAYIRHVLESNVPKAFQNGVFDVSFLRMKEDIVVENYAYDTMFAQHAAYPEFRIGLDFQTSMYTREPYYKDEGKHWDPSETADVKRFMMYNGKDSCVTLEIAEEQERDELNDPGVRAKFDHTMALAPIVVDIMCQGLPIDRVTMDRIRRDTERERDTLQRALDEHVLKDLASLALKADGKRKDELIAFARKVAEGLGTPEGGLNVGSAKDIGYYLYTIRGIKPKTSKTGADTTAEDALKELYGETGDAIILTIVSIRKARKLLSSYLRMKLDERGYTYFSVNPVGTKTARWSTSKTIDGYGLNVQTFPPKLREMIVAEPGTVLGYFDLSQAEDRVVSYHANIEKKIWAFENGKDAHILTASLIFNRNYDDLKAEAKEYKEKHGKEHPQRYLGKQSNHAFNYGEGPIRFFMAVNKRADETGIRITRAEAKTIRSGHLRAYPEIEWYQHEIEAQLKRNRTLVNPFGWKRVFSGRLDDQTFRDAYSWMPQSVAPHVIDEGAIALYRAGLPKHGLKIRLQVHDALLIQVPRDAVEDMTPEILKLMTIPIPINGREIIIPVDYKFGPNWKELG